MPHAQVEEGRDAAHLDGKAGGSWKGKPGFESSMPPTPAKSVGAYTPNPAPQTLNPAPCTLHPQPQTLISKSSTFNSKL